MIAVAHLDGVHLSFLGLIACNFVILRVVFDIRMVDGIDSLIDDFIDQRGLLFYFGSLRGRVDQSE